MTTYDSSIYEQESAALASRGTGSTDFIWLDLNKPSSKGSVAHTNVRLLPRRAQDGTLLPRFWVRRVDHVVKLDGKDKWLVCPDNHDDRHRTITCPLCLLRKALFDAGKDEAARAIDTRTRCFAQVVDVDNANSHWEESGGSWVVRPKVLGYGVTVQKGIMPICASKGPVEHPEIGRNLRIEVEKIGDRKQDIRYRVSEGTDKQPLPSEWQPILDACGDLKDLAKAASMETLAAAAAKLDTRTGGGALVQAAGYGAPPRPPAAPSPAPLPPSGRYSYSGPTGVSQADLTVAEIAHLVAAAPQAQHDVWQAGWPAWRPATSLPGVAPAPPPAAAMAPPPVAPAPPPAAVAPAPPPAAAMAPPPVAGGFGGYPAAPPPPAPGNAIPGAPPAPPGAAAPIGLVPPPPPPGGKGF